MELGSASGGVLGVKRHQGDAAVSKARPLRCRRLVAASPVALPLLGRSLVAAAPYMLRAAQQVPAGALRGRG